MTIKSTISRIADVAISFFAIVITLGVVQIILYVIDPSSVLKFDYSLGLITGNTIVWGLLFRPISGNWIK